VDRDEVAKGWTVYGSQPRCRRCSTRRGIGPTFAPHFGSARPYLPCQISPRVRASVMRSLTT
jgi:hypothetical protein